MRSRCHPVTAVTFPRLVNSKLIPPIYRSAHSTPLTLDKYPRSCVRHFRGKIRPRVGRDVPSGQDRAARFEISTVTNESGPRSRVSRFHLPPSPCFICLHSIVSYHSAIRSFLLFDYASWDKVSVFGFGLVRTRSFLRIYYYIKRICFAMSASRQ